MSIEWITPAWARHYYKDEELVALTDAQLDAMDAEAQAAYEANCVKSKKLNEQIDGMVVELSKLLGSAHKVIKQVRAAKLYASSAYSTKSGFGSLRERRSKLLYAASEAQRKATAEAETAKLQEEAVVWLLERGKKLGIDYQPGTAIATANEMAYNEEVARQIAAGGVEDFDGKNCEGPCLGWDGESHRCCCGNRRMYWARGDSHTFKNPYIYAEAY